MKIAYVYDVIYPYVKGGAEKRFWEVAKRLAEKGHEVHLFGMRCWEGEDYFVKDGVHIHGLGRPKGLYLKSGIRNTWQVLSFTLSIFPALVKERFDIIDCNAFPYLPFFPVRFYAWLKKIPLIITWQEVWGRYWYAYLGYYKGFIARLIEKLVIGCSSAIVTYSQKTKCELMKRGISTEKITIIPPGIDLKIIEGVTVSSETSDIIFAGRLIKEKNVDILLKAVELLRKQIPNVKCLIIGEGPEKTRLIKLAESLHIEGNIFFKPFLEYKEMLSLLKASKVFVFPSVREGFGIAVIEAMACALPVITVDHPMNSSVELVRDGENGFICLMEIREIAHKISRILNGLSLKESFSVKARGSIKGYCWDKIINESLDLYRRVIKQESIK